MPVPASPAHRVCSDRPQAVQEFNIENIEALSKPKRSGDLSLGVVKIGLHLQAPPPVKVAVPAPQEIAPGNARIVAHRLIDLAAVNIALQRGAVRGSSPVTAKTELPLVPAVACGDAVRARGIEDI